MSSIDSTHLLSKVASSDNVVTYEKTSTWQNFKDSFKRPEPSAISPADMELGEVQQEQPQLKKTLKKRQLQMIAIGGVIGTGLFIGSGTALRAGGPASVLLAWAVVSSFLYCTMQALAELVAVFPITGSFSIYASRFVEPSWGFAVGWNYALFWILVLPLELVACSLTINYWPSHINPVAWVAIFYVLIIALNLYGNKGFAEAEFVFSIIKICAILGFNILAIVLICGGGPEGGYIGTKNWHHPGAFKSGFKGFSTVLITATYSLAGTELVGLTAAEAEDNPRIVLPKAIKQVFYRIVIFYMLTLTLIGFLVPSDSTDLLSDTSTALASPFVIAIKNGGIKVLPSIFNVVILLALLSIGNSSVYGFSRTMVGLAEQGLAPKIFAYIDRAGRPLVGIMACAIFGLLSFVAASPHQSEVLAWLLSLAGLSTLFTWFSICVCHIRFRMAMKHQGRSIDELPYLSQSGFWGSAYSAVLLVIVLCLQFWVSLFPLHKKPAAKVFFQNYVGALVVIFFYVCHKLYARNLNILIPISELDIEAGRKDVDIDKLKQEILEEKEELASKPWYTKLRAFLF